MSELVNMVFNFLVLLVLLIPLLAVYKYRAQIKAWISKPSELFLWQQNRTKIAGREVEKARWKLEDAEDYLNWLKEKDAQKAKDKA